MTKLRLFQTSHFQIRYKLQKPSTVLQVGKPFIPFVLLIALFFSTGKQAAFAQIQFEQVLPLPPAPQMIEEFGGMCSGAISAADIDLDGDMDVLIIGSSSIIGLIAILYVNDGLGNYTAVSDTPFNGVGFEASEFADVDGDGDQDVLITGYNYSYATTNLYINDGLGNFGLSNQNTFEGVRRSAVAFADVDGDFDLDILITGQNDSDQNVSILYLNNGSGLFVNSENVDLDGVNRGSVAFSDLDGDLDLDLVITGVTSFGECIAKLYINDGSGIYELSDDSTFFGVFDSSIACADVDNDGDNDVMILGYSLFSEDYSTILYLNNGDGSFYVSQDTFFPQLANGTVDFSDLDNDGDQDLLITGSGVGYEFYSGLYSNVGNGEFELYTTAPFDNVSSSSVAIVDANGDTDNDIIISGRNRAGSCIAKMYENLGSLNFSYASGSPFLEAFESSVSFSDVDLDGDDDILITGSRIQTILYLNDGNGNYNVVAGTPFGSIWNGSSKFLDVDGDGDDDLIISGSNDDTGNLTALYTNDGEGNFALFPNTPFEILENTALAFADIDGDGDNDVVLCGDYYGYNYMTKLYTNDGLGNYSLVLDTPFENVSHGSIAFADADSDGDVDLFISGKKTHNLSISKLYINDGTGNFSVQETSFVGVGESSIAFADVDSDGDQDLLVTGKNNAESGVANLYINDGDGNYTVILDANLEGVYDGDVAFSDIDGDGDVDLLITGFSNQVNCVANLYLNDGMGNYEQVIGLPFEKVFKSAVGFTDTDNDGDQDLVLTGVNNFFEAVSYLYRNVSGPPCSILPQCHDLTLMLSSPGYATLNASDLNDGSSVSCGVPVLSLSQTQFNCAHLGVNDVFLFVADEFGNLDSCSAQVTVITDPNNPVIFDDCGNCAGGDTGVEPCVQDCNGDFSGSAYLDDCGICDSIPENDNTTCSTVLNGLISSLSLCQQRNLTVRVYLPGTAMLVETLDATISQDGNFSFDISVAGTYDVVIYVEGYLQKGFSNISISDATEVIVVEGLINGDFNEDNMINSADFAILCFLLERTSQVSTSTPLSILIAMVVSMALISPCLLKLIG